MRVDWSKRAGYIGERHGISVAWADEAVNDRHAVWQVPDPASRSGLLIRVIGYSPSVRAVLTVILISPTRTLMSAPTASGGAAMPGWRMSRTGVSTVRSSKNEPD